MVETDQVKLTIDQKESISLEKNTKGYNWAIKILIENKEDNICLARLEMLNNKMAEVYGGSE